MSDELVLAALERGRRVGSWWRAVCPFCEKRTGKPDRRGSFSVSGRTGYYQCFKCAVYGRLYGGVPDRVALKEDDEPALLEKPDGYCPLDEEPMKSALSAEPARAYLRSRGMTDTALWSSAKIGCCIKGKWSGRIIVPVLDIDGTWLGHVGRAWTKKSDLPYLYPRGMQRGRVLYNPTALLLDTEEPVLVVEGVFDALALWPHAVAVLGKPSSWQMDVLAASARPIAICLDGDAWQEGQALAWSLQMKGQRAGSIRLPPRMDPDELPKDELFGMARECIAA